MKASLFLIVVCALGAASAFPRAPKPHNAVQHERLAPHRNGFSKDVKHQEANRDNAGGLDYEGAGFDIPIVASEGEFELNDAATILPDPDGPQNEMKYLRNGMGNEDSEGQFELNKAATVLPDPDGPQNEMTYLGNGMRDDNSEGEFELNNAATVLPDPDGPQNEMKYLGDGMRNDNSEGEFELNNAATVLPDPDGPQNEMKYLGNEMGNEDSEGEFELSALKRQLLEK